MNAQKIRVRYAPSPTGRLHIGGARSALFNYLFAKKNGGDFIIRLEDTDLARNILGGEDSQIDGLEWIGVVADESPRNPNPKHGPYRQTEKLKTYREYANYLIEKGLAYYCYCTDDDLDSDRATKAEKGINSPRYNRTCLNASEEDIQKWKQEGRTPCIRVKLQDNHVIKFTDLVRGEVEFNNDDIGDWVIIKSNGIPTYNFAVVIDDHDMEITHVFRGEEHLSNTPKQLQLFEYFNWTPPKYGHMSLIINQDGKKLSKRDPHILSFLEQYEEMGYLPEAIMNFILLLGWSPTDNKELFSLEEAIECFDENRLSSSPSTFDPQKLNWINNQYLKNKSSQFLLQFITPFLQECYDLSDKSEQWIAELIDLFKDQMDYGKQIQELAKIFFEYQIEELTPEIKELATSQESGKLYDYFIDNLPETLDKESVKQYLKTIGNELKIKGKGLYMPLRLMVSGAMHGPDLVTIIHLLGKEEIIKRAIIYKGKMLC